MNTTEFSQKIKAKYPQYKGVDDATLVNIIIEKYPQYKSQISDLPAFGSETIADVKQFVTDLKNNASELNTKIAEANQRKVAGTQSGLHTEIQNILNTLGFAAEGVGDVFKGGVKALLPAKNEEKVKENLSTLVNNPIVDSIRNIANKDAEKDSGRQAQGGVFGNIADKSGTIFQKYDELKQSNPSMAGDIDALKGLTNFLLLFVGGEGVDAGAPALKSSVNITANELKTAVKEGVETAGGAINKIAQNAGSTTEELGSKIGDFIAPELDDRTITILKETPRSKIDEYVEIAEQASKDPRKLTPFEVVGNKLSDATKYLQKMRDAAGKAKSDIVHGLRHGLDLFETKPYVNKLVSLKNSLSIDSDKKFVQNLINRLNETKSAGSADSFVDDVQDMLYRGSKDMTIPSGSALEKQIRGVLGEINTALKNQLPKEYAAKNLEFSRLTKAINSLNRSLGEVVDGTAVRGAGLIKQFFSPSGSKAKELFDFIKTQTGIDLAQDATLAKYAMELFNDSRAKSILEGLPTSREGVVNKVIDFMVDKTGLGEGIQKAIRKASISNAKDLAK